MILKKILREEALDISSMSQNLQNPFKNKNPARNPQHPLLLVPILVGRLIEKFHEDGVVQQLSTHHESLHLLTHVDWKMAFRDPNGSPPFLVGPAGSGGCSCGGGIGSEEEVLGRVRDPRHAPDQLLHLSF